VGRDDGFQAEAEEYVLRNRVEGRVRIVNNVYETRFDYYFMADVFLGFPTIFEETMLASIEAMACGTPIVVSREADIPFVEEELAGKVIDFNLQAAVEAMSEITQNLTSFQVNARRVVATHFSGTAASKKLKALFHDAMSRNLSPKDDASQGIELEWLGENSRAERTSSMAAGE
jgi:glycosyltransferase involved in cell wall biosynthesis